MIPITELRGNYVDMILNTLYRNIRCERASAAMQTHNRLDIGIAPLRSQ